MREINHSFFRLLIIIQNLNAIDADENGYFNLIKVHRLVIEYRWELNGFLYHCEINDIQKSAILAARGFGKEVIIGSSPLAKGNFFDLLRIIEGMPDNVVIIGSGANLKKITLDEALEIFPSKSQCLFELHNTYLGTEEEKFFIKQEDEQPHAYYRKLEKNRKWKK